MEAEINALMAERLSQKLGRDVAADGASLIEATSKAAAVPPPDSDDWEEVAADSYGGERRY